MVAFRRISMSLILSFFTTIVNPVVDMFWLVLPTQHLFSFQGKMSAWFPSGKSLLPKCVWSWRDHPLSQRLGMGLRLDQWASLLGICKNRSIYKGSFTPLWQCLFGPDRPNHLFGPRAPSYSGFSEAQAWVLCVFLHSLSYLLPFEQIPFGSS